MTESLSAGARADLHAMVREWYQQPGKGATLEQAEAVAEEVGRAAAECAFECGAARCGTKAGYAGPSIACPCGGAARFVGHRPRRGRGLAGEGSARRAYYQCAGCQRGQVPWDQQEGLSRRVFPPRLKARVTTLCAREVFEEARDT